VSRPRPDRGYVGVHGVFGAFMAQMSDTCPIPGTAPRGIWGISGAYTHLQRGPFEPLPSRFATPSLMAFTPPLQGGRWGGDAEAAGFESCPGGKVRRLAGIRMGKDGIRSDPCYRSLCGNLRRREEVRSHFYLAPYIWGLRLTARPTAGRFAFRDANPAQPKGFMTRPPLPNGPVALSIFGQSPPPSGPKSGQSRPKLALALAFFREPDSTLSREAPNRPSPVCRQCPSLPDY
jgi:hypothetical protein